MNASPQTTAQASVGTTNPVEDPTLSRSLDDLIAQLDEETQPLLRAMLRLRKLWLERQVPAFESRKEGQQ